MAYAGSSVPHHGAKLAPRDQGNRQIITPINRSSAKGARDAAIILLGFASAMRRSELAALTLADVQFKPAGILITICRSKTDQDSEGQRVAVAHGQHAWTDPVAAAPPAWRPSGSPRTPCAPGTPPPRPLPAFLWTHRSPDRHKRLSALVERYIRPAQALEYTSSRDLGL